MNIRTEYTRYLSQGLTENSNAAIGIGEKYCELLKTPLTNFDLLDDVYGELVSLYIQAEVSLMKAYVHHMGYPSIDVQTAEVIREDFTNIFISIREHLALDETISVNYSLPTGQQTLIEYKDFQYIDALNRKIEPDREEFFQHVQELVESSPHRARFRNLFLNED